MRETIFNFLVKAKNDELDDIQHRQLRDFLIPSVNTHKHDRSWSTSISLMDVDQLWPLCIKLLVKQNEFGFRVILFLPVGYAAMPNRCDPVSLSKKWPNNCDHSAINGSSSATRAWPEHIPMEFNKAVKHITACSITYWSSEVAVGVNVCISLF